MVVAGVLTALLCGIVLWRRLGRRRRAEPIRPQAQSLDQSPEAQLVQLASEVRETLIKRFGPSLRARTTEEISGDPAIKEALGEAPFDDLIRFLATADHWKFASTPENGRREPILAQLAHWTTWHRTSLGQPPARR
jgi:hypothetical protein